MIYNHRHGFLFVHIQKTAGSSISEFLRTIPETRFLGKTHSFISQYQVPSGVYRFTFVRNPWDRLVSWYNMIRMNSYISNDFRDYMLANATSFSDFLNCTRVIDEKRSGLTDDGVQYLKSITFNQLDYIVDKEGNIAVDFVGRFENLGEDFDLVMDRLGLRRRKLRKVNSWKRDHYRAYYSDYDAEKVRRMYQRDIEHFNYSF